MPALDIAPVPEEFIYALPFSQGSATTVTAFFITRMTLNSCAKHFAAATLSFRSSSLVSPVSLINSPICGVIIATWE